MGDDYFVPGGEDESRGRKPIKPPTNEGGPFSGTGPWYLPEPEPEYKNEVSDRALVIVVAMLCLTVCFVVWRFTV